jgi:hypothetical protein
MTPRTRSSTANDICEQQPSYSTKIQPTFGFDKNFRSTNEQKTWFAIVLFLVWKRKKT